MPGDDNSILGKVGCPSSSELQAIRTLHPFCRPPSSGRGRSPIVAIDELGMGLRPTHRDENRFEPKPLRSNWRGTAKTGATLDLLRPMTSLVWDACLNQSVSRHPSRWDGW